MSINSNTGGWRGTSLLETHIAYVLLSAFYAGLPMDSNAVYFVLTSSEVSVGSFCSAYCGKCVSSAS